jgi:hypothetical protein
VRVLFQLRPRREVQKRSRERYHHDRHNGGGLKKVPDPLVLHCAERQQFTCRATGMALAADSLLQFCETRSQKSQMHSCFRQFIREFGQQSFHVRLTLFRHITQPRDY